VREERKGEKESALRARGKSKVQAMQVRYRSFAEAFVAAVGVKRAGGEKKKKKGKREGGESSDPSMYERLCTF